MNATTRQAAHDTTVPAPDPAQVRAAVNRAAAASQAVTSAQHAVGDAQARLDAAKRMAADAAAARDGDGHTTATRLHSAADAGIPPDSFWHKLGDALGKAWHILVEIAKVVVVIAAVIAIIVGGPIAWVVFAAAVIILADTVAQYAQGKASLLDVGLAALGCIPAKACSKTSPSSAASPTTPPPCAPPPKTPPPSYETQATPATQATQATAVQPAPPTEPPYPNPPKNPPWPAVAAVEVAVTTPPRVAAGKVAREAPQAMTGAGAVVAMRNPPRPIPRRPIQLTNSLSCSPRRIRPAALSWPSTQRAKAGSPLKRRPVHSSTPTRTGLFG